MATATKKKKRKEEAYPWKAGASSGHITNLKQSILETFDIYGFYADIRVNNTKKRDKELRHLKQTFTFFKIFKKKKVFRKLTTFKMPQRNIILYQL
jgi:hypothetical protein